MGNGINPAERRPTQQDQRPKLARGEILLGVRKSRRRLLAYSREFREFARKNRGIVRAYQLIRDNLEILRGGRKEVVDEKNGITIREDATGSYKGGDFSRTYRASIGGHDFFVKRTTVRIAGATLSALRFLDDYLRTKNYQIGGFKVQIIKPHLIYESTEPKVCYLVTDFYHKDEVTQVSDMQSKLGEKVKEAVLALRRGSKADSLGGQIVEIELYNAFYHKGTNTIFIYDIK